MIRAVFLQSGQCYTGFTVSGHAGYAERGEDIVCAAVSSAVQLTCNAITDVVRVKAQVQVRGDTVSLRLPQNGGAQAVLFVEALCQHLQLIAGDYSEHLSVEVTQQEVQ